MNKKIYKTKAGLKFIIAHQSLPCVNDVVVFTQDEYDWLKNKGYTGDSEEFIFIWNQKKIDHLYEMIPSQEIEANANLGSMWAKKIIDDLKGKGNA